MVYNSKNFTPILKTNQLSIVIRKLSKLAENCCYALLCDDSLNSVSKSEICQYLINMYFEKQGIFSSQCGKCAINNIMGDLLFSTEQLNNICDTLSKEVKKDYRHILGGDYDVNVLVQALRTSSKECKWVNNNQFEAKKEQIVGRQNLRGFLINRQLEPSFFKGLVGLSDRHWVAVRRYNGQFYLLDSKSSKNMPESVESISNFLQKQILLGSYVIQVNDVQ